MSTEYNDSRGNEESDSALHEDSDEEDREQELEAKMDQTFAGIDDSVNSILLACCDSTEEVFRKEEPNGHFDPELNPQSSASAMESSVIPTSSEDKNTQNAVSSSGENYFSKYSSESAMGQNVLDHALQAKFSELNDQYVAKCAAELQLKKEVAECRSYKENFAKLEERLKRTEILEKRFQDLQVEHSKACDRIIDLEEKLEQLKDAAKREVQLVAKSLKRAEADKEKWAMEYSTYYKLYKQQVEENAKLDSKLFTLNTLFETERRTNNEIRKKLEDAEAVVKPLQGEKKNHKEEQHEKIMETLRHLTQDMQLLKSENAELKSLLEAKDKEIGEFNKVISEWKNKYNKVVSEKEEIARNLNVVQEKYDFLHDSGNNHEDIGLKRFLIEKDVDIEHYVKIKGYDLELQRLTAQLETEQNVYRHRLMLKDKEIQEKEKAIEENKKAFEKRVEEQYEEYTMILKKLQNDLRKRWEVESAQYEAQIVEIKRQCDTTSSALRDALLKNESNAQEFTKLKSEVERLTKENKTLENKISIALNEKNHITTQLEKAASRENELEACLASNRETELIKFEHEVEILTTENETLRNRITSVLNEKNHLTAQLKKAVSRENELKACPASSSQTEPTKLKNEVERLTKENETLKEKITEALNEKNHITAQLEKATSHENYLNARLTSSSQAELIRLKKTVEKLTKENETLKHKIADALDEKNHVTTQLEKAASHENELKACLASSSQTELIKLKKTVDKLTKENETLKHKIADALDEKNHVTAQLEKAASHENELKACLASSSQTELTKLKNEVERLTKVNETLEDKISHALSEKNHITAQLEKATSHENGLNARLTSSNQAELTKLKKKVEKLTKENETLMHKIADALDEKNHVTAQLEKAASHENELKAYLASSSQTELIKLKNEVERLTKVNETLEDKISHALSEKNHITAQLEKATLREKDLNARLTSSNQAELTKFKKKVEKLTKENETLKHKIADALNEKNHVTMQLEKAASRENELKACLASSSQTELTMLKNEVEGLTKVNETLENKISDALSKKNHVTAQLEKAASRENDLNARLASSSEIQMKFKHGVERLIIENETLRGKISDLLNEKNHLTAELGKAAARENDLESRLASGKETEKSTVSQMHTYYEKLNHKNKELKAMKRELDTKKTLLLETEIINQELLKRIHLAHPKPITRTFACQTEQNGPLLVRPNLTKLNMSPVPHPSGKEQCCNAGTKRATCHGLPRHQSTQCDMHDGSIFPYIKRDLCEFVDQMSKNYATNLDPSSSTKKRLSPSTENTKTFLSQSVQTEDIEQRNGFKLNYTEYAETLKTTAKEIAADINVVSSGEPHGMLDDTFYEDPDVNATSINGLIASLFRLKSTLKHIEMN